MNYKEIKSCKIQGFDEMIRTALVVGNNDDFKPLVSIIMPVYNHPDFFKKSLLSAISQKTNIPFEIIVVDNNHPEMQPLNQEIVSSVCFDHLQYYVNEQNLKFCGNCNMGINLARGKYVTFCHDDDILSESALETLMDAYSRFNEDDAAIFGNFSLIDENDKIISKKTEWDYLFMRHLDCYKINMYDLLDKNYTNGCGALYNRKRLIEIGGFHGDYSPCADYALNVTYTLKFGSYAIKDITFNYRVSPQSDTRKVYLKMIEVNKKIQDDIIKSGRISHFFPQIVLKFNQKLFLYKQQYKWERNKPILYKYILAQIVHILYCFSMMFSRRLR